MNTLENTQFVYKKARLEQMPSEKTLDPSEIHFSGKVISVSEFHSASPLKRFFTLKKNECGLNTRKKMVTLEIHSNSVKEFLDGELVANMDLSSLQFGIIPSKQGKRFQFTLQARSDGKWIKREYEVQTASELAIWYSQINREPLKISPTYEETNSNPPLHTVLGLNANTVFEAKEDNHLYVKEKIEPTGQQELFWKEFFHLIQTVRQSIDEQIQEISVSDAELTSLLYKYERITERLPNIQ
jgi:hypothetical protein